MEEEKGEGEAEEKAKRKDQRKKKGREKPMKIFCCGESVNSKQSDRQESQREISKWI
jgi:hypothetical protein